MRRKICSVLNTETVFNLTVRSLRCKVPYPVDVVVGQSLKNPRQVSNSQLLFHKWTICKPGQCLANRSATKQRWQCSGVDSLQSKQQVVVSKIERSNPVGIFLSSMSASKRVA